MKKISWVHRGPTIDAQNYIRNFVLEKRSQSDFKVIDIGGGLANWAQDFSDVCVDMTSAENESVITGDLYDPQTWAKIDQNIFDLAILSHILEDVRDPFYIIEKTLEIASLVYISIPSIFLEFEHIESNRFVGYHHHRWLFACDGFELFVAPKTSLTNAWRSPKKIFHTFFDLLSIKFRGESDYVHLHTRLGWAKSNFILSDMNLRVGKNSSLSLLIDKDTKITSYDYIEGGPWLLDKYNKMLKIEKTS